MAYRVRSYAWAAGIAAAAVAVLATTSASAQPAGAPAPQPEAPPPPAAQPVAPLPPPDAATALPPAAEPETPVFSAEAAATPPAPVEPPAAALPAEAPAPAAKTIGPDFKLGNDDFWVKPGFLLQPWVTLTQERGTGEELDLRFSPYLRRARIMLTAQLSRYASFFFETDSPDFGKYGDFSPTIYPQDAWLEVNPHEAIQIDAGLLMAPFSHHGMMGATSLMTLDYHSKLMRPAPGGNKVWRDLGVMLRGLPAGKWLEYRLAVLGGVHGSEKSVQRTAGEDTWNEPTDPRNVNDWPRLSGRLVLNVLEPEGGPGCGGYFYKGTNIKLTEDGVVSSKSVLSFGASVDWQRDLNVTWASIPTDTTPRGVAEYDDYFAFAGDAFLDVPVDDAKLLAVTAQLNFYYYDHGDRSTGQSYYDTYDAAAAASGKAKSGAFTGYGLAGELGFRAYAFQPVLAIDWYNSTKAATPETGDCLALSGGLNWWWLGNTVNFKVHGGGNKESGLPWARFVTLQGQVLF